MLHSSCTIFLINRLSAAQKEVDVVRLAAKKMCGSTSPKAKNSFWVSLFAAG